MRNSIRHSLIGGVVDMALLCRQIVLYIMRITAKEIVEKWWLQEILIFVTLFMLFTLNDWMLIDSWSNFGVAMIYFGILYVHAQIHRFFLLPVLLDRYKPVPYLLSGTALILVFAGVLYAVKKYWLYPECYLLIKTDVPQTYLFHIATVAVSLIAIIAPFLLLRFYRQQKSKVTLDMCMNQVELNALRSQLNPHFMFNTFNNLYGISLHEPSRMPDLIMQISQLMRYQLDNSNRQWVTIGEELAFIEGFIALEEERVGCRCEITYDYSNDSPDTTTLIAPMMLITFIENAFKHGANSIDQCYVNIDIRVERSILHMRVVNSIPKNRHVPAVSSGIGLPNTEQRLHILYPGKRHSLNRRITPKEYEVNLTLQLSA